MRIYTNKQINILSFLITVIIFFIITAYIPKLYKTINSYIYYKAQPKIVEEYE